MAISPDLERRIVLTTSLGLGLAGIAFLQLCQGYYIPSHSMDETLNVGDLVLAEKLSAKLGLPLERGDIVAFDAPERLRERMRKDGVRYNEKGDRVIKRVAATAGEKVQMDEYLGSLLVDGSPVKQPGTSCLEYSSRLQSVAKVSPPSDGVEGLANIPEEVNERIQRMLEDGKIDEREAAALAAEFDQVDEASLELIKTRAQSRILGRAPLPTKEVPNDTVFVVGDCAPKSVDSRSFGPLDASRVTARPFIRIWPLNRFGAIETEVDLNPFKREFARRLGKMFNPDVGQ